MTRAVTRHTRHTPTRLFGHRDGAPPCPQPNGTRFAPRRCGGSPRSYARPHRQHLPPFPFAPLCTPSAQRVTSSVAPPHPPTALPQLLFAFFRCVDRCANPIRSLRPVPLHQTPSAAVAPQRVRCPFGRCTRVCSSLLACGHCPVRARDRDCAATSLHPLSLLSPTDSPPPRHSPLCLRLLSVAAAATDCVSRPLPLPAPEPVRAHSAV